MGGDSTSETAYVVMTLWDLGPVAESPSLVAFVSHVAIEQGRATHSDMTS